MIFQYSFEKNTCSFKTFTTATQMVQLFIYHVAMLRCNRFKEKMKVEIQA